jgi:hypothetical protein
VTGFAADGAQPPFPAARAPVYLDAHETSLPLIVLGAVIAVGAAMQLASGGAAIGMIGDWPTALRNHLLTCWALGVGGIGVFEGFFGITNRLPMGIWAAWDHPAIYLLLGALTFLAGTIIRARERSAAR